VTFQSTDDIVFGALGTKTEEQNVRGDGLNCGSRAMRDRRGTTEILVSTSSTEPLTGAVHLLTAGAAVQFQIDEDIAHRICIELERFLTRQ
jgi:hypothetical protein